MTSLLPSSSGPFEQAISEAWGERYDAQRAEFAVLRTLWDPWTCPAAELPALAWAWSVDIWNPNWPEERKRLVIAEARTYHRRKTTVAGFRMALGYVDAELVRAHLPRHGFFAGRAPDPAQHAAWLAALPEIRIRRVTSTTRPGRAGFFSGRRVARSAERVVLESRTAELVRNGVATPLAFIGTGLDADGRVRPIAEQLVVPSTVKSTHIHVGRGARRIVAPRGSGAGSVITLAVGGGVDADGFEVRATWPSLTPIDVIPRLVAEPHTDGRGFIVGGFRRFVRANTADSHFWWSIRLADGSTERMSTMSNRVGRSRTRRASYTLGLLVHAPATPRSRFSHRSRLAHAGPADRVAEIMAAADQARAARDTLFIDINSVRPMRFADLATLPAITRYGQYVRT